LPEAEGFDSGGGGGVKGPATPFQLAKGESAGLASAAFLTPFRKDVLKGAGVASEVFGDAEGGHDLGGRKTLKTFRKNRHD